MTQTITEKSEKNKTADVNLIRIIKTGSKRESDKAFEVLYNKYYNLILYRMNQKFNSTDAEDLTAELFAKLHRKIEMYDENSAAFNTWLYKLTTNAFIDFLRKRKLETVDLENNVDDEGHVLERNFLSEEKTPDQIVFDKEKSDLLRAVIDKTLKEKPILKKLIELRYFEEMSYDEMVQETSLPLGTVKALLHRAKKALTNPCNRHGLKIK